MSMKNIRYLVIFPIMIIMLISGSSIANQPIKPQEACAYLTSERFRGDLEYKKNLTTDGYICSSLRKPVDKGEPLGSDIKYTVKGNEFETHQVSLLLRMNSHRISTPVLREFVKYSSVIYEKAFGEILPSEIKKSILSAIRGEWKMNDHNLKLIRQHDRAFVYELNFIIEK